jgi:hypothetical protein
MEASRVHHGIAVIVVLSEAKDPAVDRWGNVGAGHPRGRQRDRAAASVEA